MKNWLKLLNRNVPLSSKPEAINSVSRVIEDRQLLAVLAKDHYFRALSNEESEAVSVIDNRKVGENPNNSVLITCDHASRDLKGFRASVDEEHQIRSNDGFDPGAAELADYISEATESLCIMTNFSKLLIDPGLPLCSEKLIRTVHDSDQSTIVSFNSNKYDLDSRITTYYTKYHKILSEAMWFL